MAPGSRLGRKKVYLGNHPIQPEFAPAARDCHISMQDGLDSGVSLRFADGGDGGAGATFDVAAE